MLALHRPPGGPLRPWSGIVPRGFAFLAPVLGACVWVNGNPEIAAPRIVDHMVSAPPPEVPEIAWSTRMAPTPNEVSRLESLREVARSRRMKSIALVDAETTACRGLSGDDRDISPFFYDRDIIDVVPLRADRGTSPGALEGAIVTFQRVEGLTSGRLERLMDCQLARDAALLYAAPETRWCPLAVRGVSAYATRDDRGLRVRLLATDPDGAVETYRRALALRPARAVLYDNARSQRRESL